MPRAALVGPMIRGKRGNGRTVGKLTEEGNEAANDTSSFAGDKRPTFDLENAERVAGCNDRVRSARRVLQKASFSRPNKARISSRKELARRAPAVKLAEGTRIFFFPRLRCSDNGAETENNVANCLHLGGRRLIIIRLEVNIHVRLIVHRECFENTIRRTSSR